LMSGNWAFAMPPKSTTATATAAIFHTTRSCESELPH
jgi:hypothetical protein